jgi:YegS/Rv2252/BmrU family lipid kinase
MKIPPEKRPPLGYIPSGTTNDFAATNGLDTSFLLAAENIAKANVRDIDVGRFNDRYFAYVAAFGAFTTVSYATPQQFKNVFGHAAYILEGIKSLPEIKPHRMRVETQNGTIDGEFIYGMVSNTVSVGGMKALPEEAVDLNDGLFEVILVNPIENVAGFNQLIADFAAKSSSSKAYVTFKTKKITFVSDEELPWTLDGEFGGSQTKVEIENVHSAIKLIG